MIQAEIHLRQHKECVVSDLAVARDEPLTLAIEELHDELVTFVLELGEGVDEAIETLRTSDQVRHVEDFGDGNVLVTKESCGAYSAIERNHGILRRHTSIGPTRRVYSVLLFRREDLGAMIEEFRDIGTVTLEKLSAFDGDVVRLTDRQYEVMRRALDAGYFEWPREVTSEELAAEIDISRATLLEHLRKAESKLLADALDRAKTGTGRPGPTEPASPPE